MTVAARSDPFRRDMLAKLHIAAKQLGLDEETYRDALAAATGKRSAGEMDEGELRRALEHFEAHGFAARAREKDAADLVYLPKVRALWISGWHLGVVRDRSDAAMTAFIRRQTGIDAARWVTSAGEARKVIEGLKTWLAREAGVEWGADGKETNPRKAVVWAQFTRLVSLGDFTPSPKARGLTSADIEDYGYKVTGKAAFIFYEARDWDRLIAAAGARLRGALARRREAGQ